MCCPPWEIRFWVFNQELVRVHEFESSGFRVLRDTSCVLSMTVSQATVGAEPWFVRVSSSHSHALPISCQTSLYCTDRVLKTLDKILTPQQSKLGVMQCC